MKTDGRKATTIKIDPARYDEFKILGIRNHVTLQDVVTAVVDLYIASASFQILLNNVCKPPLSHTGSFKL